MMSVLLQSFVSTVGREWSLSLWISRDTSLEGASRVKEYHRPPTPRTLTVEDDKECKLNRKSRSFRLGAHFLRKPNENNEVQ